ncbi:MAG: KEOPS complex kinase/ATPase Bud32 [Candidatus Micrarchaeota archaeon]
MRGAEAVVSRITFIGSAAVLKNRIRKNYRAGELDTLLRKRRTRAEARLLHKAKTAGVPCPTVLCVDEFAIIMTFIKGSRPKMAVAEAKTAGLYLGKLHNAGVIHGDFTPANLIKTAAGLQLIDFGLGFFSNDVEDMAVDVFTMLKALENEKSRAAFLNGYKSCSKYKEILTRLEVIGKRMRYSG